MSCLAAISTELAAVDNAQATVGTRGERVPMAELSLRLDQAWKVLNLNQELIRAADQKVYLLIVMSTLLVTYVSTNLEKIMRQGMLERCILILFLVAVAFFFYFALSTVISRSRNHTSATTSPRVVFFGDISGHPSPQGYADAFRGLDLHDLLDDICCQIHSVGSIVGEKYRFYRRAWMALLVEVSLFLLLEFSLAL